MVVGNGLLGFFETFECRQWVTREVQAAWGEVDFPCFVEALRHELHTSSASRLHTAYFHSIDLSGRADGPTLVKVQTSRVEQNGGGDVAIVEESLKMRHARPGAPSFAISSADYGLAGRVGLSYIKQLLPRIPGDVMAALGIVRIVQKPLQAVITFPMVGAQSRLRGSRIVVQGLVFHYTISTGTSEAEATNFNIDLPGRQFVDIWRSWCQYARRCAEIDPAEFDSIIAVVRSQLFNDSVPKEQYTKLQQENSKLVSECKRVQDLAASRQAALEEYTSLLSRMNAVSKPK
ncbi:g1086 [Coccomyxa elongata]